MTENIILEDIKAVRANLLPLTYTRPVADIRVGITTIRDKWRGLCPDAMVVAGVCEEYMLEMYPRPGFDGADTTFHVAGHIIPDESLVSLVLALEPGQTLMCGTEVIAWRGEGGEPVMSDTVPAAVRYLYDIFTQNGDAIRCDYARMTAGRVGATLSSSNTLIGDPTQVFVEDGAWIEGCCINTQGGPVYIGRKTTVMEGSLLRGPLGVCDHATVNMGTKLYPDTTIGPWCKVGGELNNVVMLGYSNKAHDGFLGNAVIGEWCNLGAGCVASNLKNDYTPIKLWNYAARRFMPTGLQFCGLIMGDHSKCGINTMLNTATVLGVGVNIHGSGFPRNFVPSFSEGGAAGFYEVSMSKFFDIARRVMGRRGCNLTAEAERMFMAIRYQADEYK